MTTATTPKCWVNPTPPRREKKKKKKKKKKKGTSSIQIPSPGKQFLRDVYDRRTHTRTLPHHYYEHVFETDHNSKNISVSNTPTTSHNTPPPDKDPPAGGEGWWRGNQRSGRGVTRRKGPVARSEASTVGRGRRRQDPPPTQRIQGRRAWPYDRNRRTASMKPKSSGVAKWSQRFRTFSSPFGNAAAS